LWNFVAASVVWEGGYATYGVYLTRMLGVPTSTYGLLLSAATLIGAAAYPLAGRLALRWGGRRLLQWALMSYAAVYAAIGSGVPALAAAANLVPSSPLLRMAVHRWALEGAGQGRLAWLLARLEAGEALAAAVGRAAETAGAVVKADPDAVVAIWTPLKDLETFDGFLRRLAAATAVPTLIAEARLRPLTDPMRMNGCALVIVNPPPGADAAALEVCGWVAYALGDAGAGGGFRMANSRIGAPGGGGSPLTVARRRNGVASGASPRMATGAIRTR